MQETRKIAHISQFGSMDHTVDITTIVNLQHKYGYSKKNRCKDSSCAVHIVFHFLFPLPTTIATQTTASEAAADNREYDDKQQTHSKSGNVPPE